MNSYKNSLIITALASLGVPFRHVIALFLVLYVCILFFFMHDWQSLSSVLFIQVHNLSPLQLSDLPSSLLCFLFTKTQLRWQALFFCPFYGRVWQAHNVATLMVSFMIISPLSKNFMTFSFSICSSSVVSFANDGCPSGSFSHINLLSLELSQSDHQILGHLC